ncbi:MAG: hypothetical protein DRN57_07200 [Thermoplasmata archaeon]|nr:MAG: hypothetical protein DRN57_07200 [Thermoplasmata archaeon]
MKVLGIESTAHTFGAGVVDDGTVLSNVRDMYVPEEGGIHPREAAEHHVRVGGDVVKRALGEAGMSEGDIDLVAFSKGPGLGPCLRVGATVARVLSLKRKIPIIGANHCVAHLEIGRMLQARDPVLLYASGGNTQIIAFVKGRYRVLGETLDIGIGNMLDKLGRELGIPFPAGPKIEKLARGEPLEGILENDGPLSPRLLELPYSVKGMDVSFSGIMTAALSLRDRGADIPSICHSVQETAFSMLCEVTERALAHVGSEEVLLGGGVACNGRLRQMVSVMMEERGGRSFAPPPSLSVDNGAMIAYLGEIMYDAGIRHSLEDTMVDQRFRTDQVEAVWKRSRDLGRIVTPGTRDLEPGELPRPGEVLGRGAEAVITAGTYAGIPSVVKERPPKGYRLPELDRSLTSARLRKEVRMLRAMREAGVRTPHVLDMDEGSGRIVMELVPGPRLASVLNILREDERRDALRRMGEMVGDLHRNDIVHGDITTSNFILGSLSGGNADLCLIDASLSDRTEEMERKGVDLRLFREVYTSTHAGFEDALDEFFVGYRDRFSEAGKAEEKMKEIDGRGRYIHQD